MSPPSLFQLDILTLMNNYETLNVISMGKEIESAYPMYGLYAYGEGALLEQIKENTFTGIPVLYIPGENGFHLLISSFIQ